jgi:hypothetical protein
MERNPVFPRHRLYADVVGSSPFRRRRCPEYRHDVLFVLKRRTALLFRAES